MVRKTLGIGEKEDPRKKYCGIFANISPFGYGCGRLIVIKNKKGKKVLPVEWENLTLQREEKNITIGDKIKIDYKDMRNFTMEKLIGE